MAIDPGRVRVGVALTDPERRIAQPHATIDRRRPGGLLASICQLIRDQEVGGVVVGLPLQLDGSQGDEALAARELGREIHDRTGLPVDFLDERLTTRQAERSLVAAGVSRRRRREVGDRVAAALILESALASRRGPASR